MANAMQNCFSCTWKSFFGGCLLIPNAKRFEADVDCKDFLSEVPVKTPMLNGLPQPAGCKGCKWSDGKGIDWACYKTSPTSLVGQGMYSCSDNSSKQPTKQAVVAPSRHNPKPPSTPEIQWTSISCDHCGMKKSGETWEMELVAGKWKTSDGYFCPKCQNLANKKLDRLYQNNPDRAIKDFSKEYERGVSLASAYKQILFVLKRVWSEGAPLFIHGRDGEMVFDLLKRSGIKEDIHYGLSSRSLTTENSRPDRNQVINYLQRICPQGAVHYDTGFNGSIPKWMDKHGFCVSAIMMAYAYDSQYQIPGLIGQAIPAEDGSGWVEQEMEDCPQRLNGISSWNEISYSSAAGGYWARLYGVCDALGLPRQEKPDKASQEDIRRFTRTSSLLKVSLFEVAQRRGF